MRFYRRGEESGEQPGEVAFDASCANCKKAIPVSQYTADILVMVNAICHEKRWAPITTAEAVQCSDCYPKHRQKLADKAEWELTHQAECWSKFMQLWGTGKVDESDMERTFARDFPHLRRQMRDWIAARKLKGAPARTDAAAGFGRRA